MAKPSAKSETATTIDIVQLRTETISLRIIGTTPLLINRLAEKARRQLLMPPAKMNATDRATNLKHEPLQEFRSSVHRLPDGPTLLALPSTAFKGAMCSTAIEIPSTSKAQIGRLVYVPGEYVAVYGVPQIDARIVRSADINKTPDIRTRAIVPQWCCELTTTFVVPQLKAAAIANLIAASGIICGVGDNRQEKGRGSGNYGSFQVVADKASEKAWDSIVAAGGREQQVAALDDPHPYNSETSELLNWFSSESKRRGFRVVDKAQA